MSEAFIGEVRLVGFDFAPRGWALCNGQSLPIAQNQALFSLLGTTYGGNGTTTFNLPDLRGRAAMSFSAANPQGANIGEEAHTLTVAEIPQHTHTLQANATPALASAAGVIPGATKAMAQGLVSLPGGSTTTAQLYGSGAADRVMSPSTVGAAGGQAHENRQPFLALNYVIAVQGIFPSRN